MMNNVTSPEEEGEGKSSNKTNVGNGSDNDKKVLIIVSIVGGFLLLVLIALIAIVLNYNSKTKDLLENVNKISFTNEDKKEGDERLVLD